MKSRIRTAVDLFAGGGGLSAGFLQAGFDVVLGLDNWSPAKSTFEYNHPESAFLLEDVSSLAGDELLRAAGIAQVDVLLGGPPCQGFSTAGKRALDDPRNALVREFLRLTCEMRPRFVVLENVEGFVSFVGGRLVEEVIEALARTGYKPWHKVLQAADYGVPQRRKRFFLVATRLPVDYRFPAPTHLNSNSPDPPSPHRPPWLTFWDAVSDLPLIGAGGSAVEYASAPRNEYQAARRNNSDRLYEHVAPRHSDKLMKMMSFVPPGQSAFDVWEQIPEELRPTSGFANSYGRILADEPAPTITRNFTTPSSAQCVHPLVDRALSLREGARVQSFDDTYRFLASFTDNRLLIGNAVPPLLAKAVAEAVNAALNEHDNSADETKAAILRQRTAELEQGQLSLFSLEAG